MNILSLFDGMSCGQLALDRAGIHVDQYYASELDKYAIKVTQANWPDTIQLGDVTRWKEWDIDWAGIDLLIGGSPCQGFSMAGKQLAFDDPRSKLFFVYVDILNHIKSLNPGVKFLLENVKMKNEYLDVITEYLGVEPVFINSALVSAQNRQRYYWANWEFGQPEDEGIVLADILEDGEVNNELVFNPAAIVGRRLNERGVRDDYNKDVPITQCLQVKHNNEKMGCLTTVQKDNVISPMKPGRYPLNTQKGQNNKPVRLGVINNGGQGDRIYSRDGKAISIGAQSGRTAGHGNLLVGNQESYRRLTPVECERLQTVPDGYTAHVSNTQRYRMLGNGWTVDVIAHIFEGLK